MDNLLKRRRVLKGKITRIQKVCEDIALREISINQLSVYNEQISNLWTESEKLYEEISLLCNDQDYVTHETEFHDILDKLDALKSAVLGLHNSDSVENVQRNQTRHVSVHLPKIELPIFAGNFHEWLSFRDLFTATVHNNDSLSDVQKLQYLKLSLKGEAATLLHAIQITEVNYQKAWDTLTKRYQNETEIIYANFDRLFNQNCLQQESATGLRRLLDTTSECIDTLQILKLPVEHWDSFLVYFFRKKLDPETLRQWEMSHSRDRLRSFAEFKEFLDTRARALATLSTAKMKSNHFDKNERARPLGKQFSAAHHSASEHCVLCNGPHSIYKCEKFLSKTIAERKATVMELRLCWNCLRRGHFCSRCNSSGCKRCNLRHHSLLHVEKPNHQITSTSEEVTMINHSSKDRSSYQVLLPTAIINVSDVHGNAHTCRALLDCGSQSSFIREDCVQRLGIRRWRSKVNIAGLSSTSVGTSNGAVNLKLSSRFDPSFLIHIEALILHKITCDLPQFSADASNLKCFKHLFLADPNFDVPGPIDILLGADVWSQILLSERFVPSGGTPIAHESVFGWVISGRTDISQEAQNLTVAHHAQCDVNFDLQRFWELEEIPDVKRFTDEEEECELQFNSTHSRDSHGRYIVKLPFSKKDIELGSSKEIAVRRLRQIERRCQKNPQLALKYREFMNEYLTLGHMEHIPQHEPPKPDNCTYYIPHHAVFKEIESSTKFRIVFDASSKTSTEVSLNDKLLVGPTLQDSIVPLLIRFRIHFVAITADITKMYRQVRVSPDDTDFQRIVWREFPDKPIEEYRLLTVTYGTASAPYLAVKSMQELSKDEGKDFPNASEIIKRDFYVDDLMSGSDTIENALQLQNELIQLLNKGGFEIRKWSSNQSALLESVSPEMRETNLPLRIDCDESVKALGIQWHPASDSFSFQVSLPNRHASITKRIILSDIAKIFDPLGWLSPVTVKGKILLQSLWKLKLSWDDPLPAKFHNEWVTFCSELSCLESIRIDRCVSLNGAIQYQMHGYCDASEKSYAAVVYLRASSLHEVKIQLVLSKTKVAPLKTLSIPRLELCGAVLLAKLVDLVRKAMTFSIDEIHCWTDSTIVLSWLNSHPSRWKTFICNRVSKIQDIVPAEHWHHVASENNPADCASRGLLPSALESHSMWWNGPSTLKQPIELVVSPFKMNDDALQEERSKATSCLTALECLTNAKENIFIVDLLQRFSNLTKLKRVTAYCLRFIHNSRSVKSSIKTGFLSAEELDAALLIYVRFAQREEFSGEIKALKDGKSLSYKSCILPLNPFIDEAGLLRVGGRLRNAKISSDRKQPILLPKKHVLTNLIINYYHLTFLHAGSQLLLSLLHQKFWIIGARDVVRRHVRRCIVCFRHQVHTSNQLMGDLPAARVQPARPFLRSGVDYCGPFMLRASKGRGRTTFKGYIAVFVCFVTRAIHLELVSDLTTEAFIAALKRFIGRRGMSADIFSDCGTNFLGAARKLKEIPILQSIKHNDEVSHYLSNQGINWHFNPPSAPHMGGLWEAGVKSVKFHLKRILGSTILSFEEMYTVLVQIEACLNSRPLCPMSSDPNDLSVLTPGHFLIGDTLTAVPEEDFTSNPSNRLGRWQLLQRFFQHFWKRWSAEYLTRLQQRPKWLSKVKNLEIGDLVLIKDDHLPPLKWRLGRVLEVFPGKDDCVRVVSVKTADGLLKRPISKLSQLPVEQS